MLLWGAGKSMSDIDENTTEKRGVPEKAPESSTGYQGVSQERESVVSEMQPFLIVRLPEWSTRKAEI